ncbi:uncharacterized protein MYCFIDRAFT_174279 [Pseudocercospora fijiensis CIRAD86]|uniref:Uncharacterized protein n=1 Tax=Pseudocercospora fijiensis (strain CIRAD86) TaxID=383855 RepID=M3AZX2_PSEFD|nr:uncharacterized protein MYCFIDRAFT_174279 [Pseudocercospora fijiensis CIRAD86]EME82722.1 hypothetical protein MYCFIDRAFT_174279 [Pseudocercospora fijiensis CIRAD86]
MYRPGQTRQITRPLQVRRSVHTEGFSHVIAPVIIWQTMWCASALGSSIPIGVAATLLSRRRRFTDYGRSHLIIPDYVIAITSNLILLSTSIWSPTTFVRPRRRRRRSDKGNTFDRRSTTPLSVSSSSCTLSRTAHCYYVIPRILKAEALIG